MALDPTARRRARIKLAWIRLMSDRCIQCTSPALPGFASCWNHHLKAIAAYERRRTTETERLVAELPDYLRPYATLSAAKKGA